MLPCRSVRHCVTRARASAAYECEDYIVCTDSSEHSFGRKPTGFVVEKSPLKVRVYDKSRESNHVLEKITAVVSYRWGYWTNKAVRVEFSIGRERLKKFGVDIQANSGRSSTGRRGIGCKHC